MKTDGPFTKNVTWVNRAFEQDPLHLMRKISIGLWAGFLLLSVATCGLTQETVRITTGEWRPFLSKSLKYNGVGLRIISEAFALEGVKVTYGFFPWKRAYLYVSTGRWDASATWGYKPERDKEVFFSNPLYNSTYAFFHLKSYPFDWRTLKDLRNIKIGACSGYTYTPAFYQGAREGTLSVQFVPSDIQNFGKLFMARIQIAPVNIDVGYDLITRNFPAGQRVRITHHPRPFFSIPVHVIFSRKTGGGQRLLQLFNKGLEKLQANGRVLQYFEESRRGDYILEK